jgi:citrate lyase subunit beta/citryl-CoA lyase
VSRPVEAKSDIALADIRSLLFLPASNPRAIAKARASQADGVILDLEDAVKPSDKSEARDAAVAAVADDWPMPVGIRVNGPGSEWYAADLDAVVHSASAFIVVPRASDADLIAQIGNRAGRPVLAMIETAAGVIAAPQIAEVSAGLIAGTNDLRADLNLPPNVSRDPISAALQWIVLAAAAAKIPAFDGVFNNLVDLPAFERECGEGRSLGFSGKSLIHPDQIGPCNRLFGPTPAEIEEAQRLIAAFDGGAERFGDRMIERMHVEAARRMLARQTTTPRSAT